MNVQTEFKERVKTAVPGPKSEAIHAEKAAHVSDAVSPAFPIYIESAEGSVLTDVDGNEYIDFGSGIGVTSFGHVNDSAVKAAIEQSNKFTHTLFSVTPYELYVEVAKRLNAITPGSFAKKTVLSSTGAEANENAMKIARAYTGRNGIAVVDHGYHGRTNLTLGMNYKAAPYATGTGPRPGEIYRVPNSYPYRDGLDGTTVAKRAIAHLEKISGAENLACLMIEPIQGEGGIVVPDSGYLETLQDWCRKNGIVIVADEIQTGLGRTGKYFASEHFGFEPDLVVTAKAIAAGYPLSAVTGRSEIMDHMLPGGLSGTFSGNPVACAAAIEIFDQLEAPGAMDYTTAVGERIQAGLKDLQARYDVIGDVRGMGALHGIELVDESGEPNPAAYKKISMACLENGLLVLPGGSDGHVLRFLPAVNIPMELVDEALHILEKAMAAV